MSEHQSETEFLRHCLGYADSAEHKALDERIAQIQRDERCVRRAVWLMAVLTALAVAGLAYTPVLFESYREHTQWLIVKIISVLGLASTISLVAFVVLRMVYCIKLNQRRKECRKLVAKLLKSRLDKPVTAPWGESRVGGGNHDVVQVAAGGNGSHKRIESTARG